MSGLTVKMTGFAELDRRLTEISNDAATKAGQSALRSGATAGKKAMLSSGEIPVSDVAEGAAGNHTRSDGRSATNVHHKIINSLRVNKTKSDNGHAVSVAISVGKAYQGRFVEFGTIHQKPNPFMLRTFTAAEQTILDAIGKALNRQLIKRGV